MSTRSARSRYLAGALTPPAKVAALLAPKPAEVLEPGEPELGESAQALAPSENAGKRRRITGWYTADEVRALRGELVSIEGTIPPGRYLCTWLETPADETRRLDGEPNGGEL